MRWRKGRRSTNIEDRRGRSAGGARGFPMGRRIPGGAKLGGGIGTIIIVIIALLLGGDPMSLLNSLGGGGGTPQPQTQTAPPAANDEQAQFVSVVLADTEDTWSSIFAQHNARYQPPTLVLFNDMVQSACGMASAAAGPFYCPGDRQVYIDLDFFHELKRLGAHGDFARAYVVAHEVGHHIQNLMGTEEQVRMLRARLDKRQSNALSVMMELQADCYSGVWVHHAQKQRQILEEGDIEEGLNAAAAIGDDRLQRMSGRGVHPESFTHGSSEQRVHWFKVGMQSGDLKACDTFNQ